MRPAQDSRQSGGALPLTLILIAFNLTLLVALLLYSSTEQTASRNSVNTDIARTMALSGVEFAGALIAQNSTNNAYVTYQNITNVSGDRLETKIANTVAQGNDWTRVVQNPTALHSGFANQGSDGVDLNFATAADTNSGYIVPRRNPTNAGSTWINLHTNMFQMKWVEVYKGDTNKQTNLIGRFAFWVDDESSKLNVNYSGAEIYNLGNWQLQGNQAGGYLPESRTNVMDTNGVIAWSFDGSTWPFFMDLSSVGGIDRTKLNSILTYRGTPPIYTNATTNSLRKFSPFYSALEIRSANSAVITNVSEQSQLAFSATLYSREPELSYVKGIPRFDMYQFFSQSIADDTLRSQITNQFVQALTDNYPKFSDKYSMPQFAAAVANFYNSPSASQTFTYTPSGGESPYFSSKARPLLNEIGLKVQAGLDPAGNTTITLEAEAELIFLGTARKSPLDASSLAGSVYDELGPVGDANHAANADKYRVEIDFNPPFRISGNNIATMTLNRVDTNRWFRYQTNDYYGTTVYTVRTDSQAMTNSFGVLTNSTNFLGTNPVVWSAPTNISARIYYQSDNYQQMAPANIPNGGTATTNYLSPDSTNTFFHLTSQPAGGSGVRSDPRLGIHEVVVASAPNDPTGVTPIAINFTNTAASMNRTLNTTWRIGGSNLPTGPWSPNYTNTSISPLSPDITPPMIVFEADRGLRLINENRQFMNAAFFLQTAADIGEIPITTYKSGHHLAWSTPRLWGDGRTNLGDGIDYPPDWAMLDCIHSVYLSARKPNERMFSYSASNSTNSLEHLNHGRVNINGMKSYFQRPLGTSKKADTIIDSVLIGAYTKHFVADQTGGSSANNAMSLLSIPEGATARTSVLNFVHNQIMANNTVDRPFYSPFQFLSFLAGNTSSMLATNSFWMSYAPGSETTSERRIESLVRSLFQKVTTRGWQFNVYSIGQALQVIDTGGGTYKTNVLGEAFMQAVWERAPKHNTTNGVIENASLGGAPPMRMLYMREIR